VVYTSGVKHPLVYNTPLVNTAVQHYPSLYHTYGKREAEAEPEADPALIYTTNSLPLTPAVHSPLVSSSLHQPIVYTTGVQTPVVYKTIPGADKTEKVSTPAIYSTLPLASAVHHPVVYTSGVKHPLVYNTPLVNTAVQHYPSLYHTYGKREAEAEPEADPALIYTNTLPLTTAVHHPVVYTSGVKTPVVYNTPLTNTVYNTAAVSSAVHQPIVYSTPVLSKVFPSLKTLSNTHPIVYHTAVQPAVQTPLLKTVDNAVVPAIGGYIHSSHVGVCTNNLGARVPC